MVSTSSSFTTTVWDSGTTSMATTTQGNRSPELSYAGSALEQETTYYWRIRFSDDDGAMGAWSTATATFSYLPAIQNINFSYDSNGNITQVFDTSSTDASRTVIYAYDGLNRLLSASTTAASTTPYRHQFAYNMLGNITGMSTSSATTTYTYAETGYANPHAATSVGGATLAYDNNGNVSAIGSLDYTWDWRNRLASAERTGGGTTSYGYDHTGQRMFKATGTATTSYPNKYFNLATTTGAATTTKHIFAPDSTLLATVEGSGKNATTTYLHPDHLGGTNVTTDEDGEVTQTLDYYPYGSQRIASGTFDEQRKFTGHEHDQESDLTYANARYYDHDVGKWLSQDPASRENPEQFLNDPQQFNKYAYARNNPLRFLDQSGEVTIEFSRSLQNSLFGLGASHNAIAGYNVPGFPDGIITIAGYGTGGFPLGNTLITQIGREVDGSLASYDYELAQRIFSGDSSGVRGVSLIKDFGGLTEEQYWKALLEGGALINENPKSYNALTRNSHSALNSIKNYANPASFPYQPTWHLTPAAKVDVRPSGASSGSFRSAGAYGLSADTQITADNVGAFTNFIKQFVK